MATIWKGSVTFGLVNIPVELKSAVRTDRISFRRFAGFSLHDRTPDHSTLWRFREELAHDGLIDEIFAEITRQLELKNLVLKHGTLIDASLVTARANPPRKPRGEAPDSPAKPSADPDARWGRKGKKSVFGYKMQALVLGGIIGALGGVVWSLPGAGVTPDVFRPQITFYAYAILILGGIATKLGPLFGALMFMFVLQFAQLTVRQADGAGLLPRWLTEAVGPSALLLTGVLLMIMVVYRPQGIFGNRREIALDA
jgi:hypothetical protein